MKEILWDLFKTTGKIEYYLEYKKLAREDDVDDKESSRNSSK